MYVSQKNYFLEGLNCHYLHSIAYSFYLHIVAFNLYICIICTFMFVKKKCYLNNYDCLFCSLNSVPFYGWSIKIFLSNFFVIENRLAVIYLLYSLVPNKCIQLSE